MSKFTNSAARNQMSEFERQCYDWGWAAAEERIIKLLEEHLECRHAFDGTADACPHIDGKLFIALIEGESR